MSTLTEQVAAAWLAVEADMTALYQSHNGGALPSPEKLQEMMAALSQAQLERLVQAKIAEAMDWSHLQAAMALPDAPLFTYQG